MPNNPPLLAVSQHLTRAHGQGKINLELLERLHARGRRIEAVASWLEPGFADREGFTWRRVRVPRRTPTNWLRCELFRKQAERVARRRGVISINNGAAAVAPSRVNIAMFVHTAWLQSPWHPRRSPGWHARLLTAFNAHQSRLEKRAFSQADHVVALSDAVRGELIEHCGVPEERVRTIPPGVDSARFSPLADDAPNPLRQACAIPAQDRRPLALFVGEIRSHRKNLDLVLDALAQHADLLLAVIGSRAGSPYPARAEELGVGDRVFFLGHRGDVPRLMPGADFFVFPTHYEPFGLVVTESMASGLPVIVTRQAGSACVVDHGENGWLLDDGGDLDGMLHAIDRLVEPAVRTAWGESARRKAVSLTWDAMTDRYEKLLDDGVAP